MQVGLNTRTASSSPGVYARGVHGLADAYCCVRRSRSAGQDRPEGEKLSPDTCCLGAPSRRSPARTNASEAMRDALCSGQDLSARVV